MRLKKQETVQGAIQRIKVDIDSRTRMAQISSEQLSPGAVFASLLDEPRLESLEFQFYETSNRRKSSLIFPGSWSDVSRGALFEMEVERVNNYSCPRARASKTPESMENHESRLDDSFYTNSTEIETCERTPRNQLPKEDGQRFPASEKGEEIDTIRHALRSFTQRPTSTRSIPIPNRKPHLTYKRHNSTV